jgi:uncharacterized protein YlxW (UPF0749 family)
MLNFLRNNRFIFSLSLIFLVSGIAVSIWFKAWSINANVTTDTQNQNLIDVINQLETETSELETNIDALRTELAGNTLSGTETNAYIARLQQELAQIQFLSGQTPVTGSGLLISINDNTSGAEAAKQADPVNYYPENYIVHDSNLRYLLNDVAYLAEAVAINGQRIVDLSDIRCVGTVIIINSTRVAPPYEISLIGSPALLEGALQESSQYIYLKSKNMPIKVSREDNLTLPAYTGAIITNYAQAVTSDEQAN